MKITSDEAASAQLRLSWRKYRPWAFVAAVTIVHLLIAARSVGPMYVYDEIGYVAAGNVLAGHDFAWSLCGSSYAVGYSVLLTPLWWLPVAPLTVYQIAVFMSAALGALAIWPATALAKRFGAKGGVALAIGALVTLVPSRALIDNYVLAENPLTLLVLCTALSAFRLAADGRRLDAVLLGLSAGLATAVHARALPLAAITIAWLVVRAILKRTRWPDAGLGGATALALAVGGVLAQSAMGGRIFAEDDRLGNLVGHLNLVRVGEVIVGQAFIQVVSWAILTVLGLLAVANNARRAIRRASPGGLASAWWWFGAMLAAQATFFVWVLAGSAEFATRFDIPIFGRYLDPFVVPLAILGATTLWVKRSRRLANVALVAAGVAVVAYCGLLLPRIPSDALWIRFAVPGLMPFMRLEDTFHWGSLATAAAVSLVASLLLWASVRRARLGLIAAVVVAAGITTATDVFRIDPFEGEARAQTIVSPTVLALPEYNTTMAADLLPCLERNKLQMELAGHVDVVLSGGDYGDELVIGPTEWPAARAAGLKPVRLSAWLGAQLWAGPTVK